MSEQTSIERIPLPNTDSKLIPPSSNLLGTPSFNQGKIVADVRDFSSSSAHHINEDSDEEGVASNRLRLKRMQSRERRE